MELSRRVCLGSFLVLAGCKIKNEPEEGGKAAWPDDEPSWEPDRVVSGEGFSFGTKGKDGLVLGLRVDSTSIRGGEPIRYALALRNEGTKPVRRRLFDDNDFVYPRTKLVAERPGARRQLVGRAVGWNEASSAGLGIDMALERNETRERRGNPLPPPFDLSGGVELLLVFGGPAYAFTLESGRVHLVGSAAP